MISSSHMKPARNVYKFYLNLLSSLLWALQPRYFAWTAFSLTPSLSGDIQHEAPLVCRVKVLPPSLTSWVWALEPTSQEERPDSYSWLLTATSTPWHALTSTQESVLRTISILDSLPYMPHHQCISNFLSFNYLSHCVKEYSFSLWVSSSYCSFCCKPCSQQAQDDSYPSNVEGLTTDVGKTYTRSKVPIPTLLQYCYKTFTAL